MASGARSLSHAAGGGLPDGRGARIGLVVSEYYTEITHSLRDACLQTLRDAGVEDIPVERAPGTFELPAAADILYRHRLRTNALDAVICLGCVVRGETDHDRYINQSVATALQDLTIRHGSPFLFGVLTPNTHQQAVDRAGGAHGNKGVEVAAAALEIVSLRKRLDV